MNNQSITKDNIFFSQVNSFYNNKKVTQADFEEMKRSLGETKKIKKRFHKKWIKAITKEHKNGAWHQYNTIRNKVKNDDTDKKGLTNEGYVASQQTTQRDSGKTFKTT